MKARHALFLLISALASTGQASTTRFCLDGEFNLGARYQGISPKADEFYPVKWCVVSDDDSGRAQFSVAGNSNPDMQGSFTVSYIPPGLVRIVNRESPPDIEFHDTDTIEEARSVRRLDPHRFMSEFMAYPERFENMNVQYQDKRLINIQTTTQMPLRGQVAVEWQWKWKHADAPVARLLVDGVEMLRAVGRWEVLDEETASEVFTATPGAKPVEVPGDRWPSRVAMELVSLAGGVHLVRGVRTGFQHLVVETDDGLVIGDAPAGWVEFYQLPPADLVPGLGISGLSERLVDFLKHKFPGHKFAAVVITHHHDDHAGGARAFAAEGAAIYAPASVAAFLETALNRPAMPSDRLKKAASSVEIIPVTEMTTIGGDANPVRLVSLGSGPHVDAMLGLWAVRQNYFFVSDVHVPRSDAEAPTAVRAQTECWFARRAVALLPDSTRVINSHSQVETPVARLKSYLQSDACRLEQVKK